MQDPSPPLRNYAQIHNRSVPSPRSSSPRTPEETVSRVTTQSAFVIGMNNATLSRSSNLSAARQAFVDTCERANARFHNAMAEARQLASKAKDNLARVEAMMQEAVREERRVQRLFNQCSVQAATERADAYDAARRTHEAACEAVETAYDAECQRVREDWRRDFAARLAAIHRQTSSCYSSAVAPVVALSVDLSEFTRQPATLPPPPPSSAATEKKKGDDAALCCPITRGRLVDPVIAPSGHSYERSAILRWLSSNACDPLTREPLRAEQLITNRTLLNALRQEPEKS